MKKQFLQSFFNVIVYFILLNTPITGAELEPRESIALKDLHAILDEEFPPSTLKSEMDAHLDSGMQVMETAKSLRINASDLASSVQQEDLANIYRQHEGTINGLCENTSEERLKNLYPIFKIAIAYWLKGEISTPKIDGILTLVCSQSNPSFDTFSLLLLRSLNPLRNDIYYGVIYEIVSRIQPHYTGVMSAHSLKVCEIERFAFELLRVGKNVENINKILFKTNPARERLASKLTEWCKANSALINPINNLA